VERHAEEVSDSAGGDEAISFIEAGCSPERECCIQRDAMTSGGEQMALRLKEEAQTYVATLPLRSNGHAAKVTISPKRGRRYCANDGPITCDCGMDRHAFHAFQNPFHAQNGVCEGARCVLITKWPKG
jgi:hypothetical protein